MEAMLDAKIERQKVKEITDKLEEGLKELENLWNKIGDSVCRLC